MYSRQIYLLTVATDTTQTGYLNWKTSVEHAGWPASQVVVLGEGEPWQGWAWRCRKILGFCRTLQPDDYLIICDAYDALVFGSPQEFKALLQAQGCDILFGIDYACIKNTDFLLQKSCSGSVTSSRDVFINGGGLMGKVQYLALGYEYIQAHHSDDQIGWHQYLTEQRYPSGTVICFDEGNEMIFNMMFGDHKKREGNQWNVYLNYLEMLFFPGTTTRVIRGTQGAIRGTQRPLLSNGSTPLIIHTPGLKADGGARYNYIGTNFLPRDFRKRGLTFGSLSAIAYTVLIGIVYLLFYSLYSRIYAI